MKLAEKILKVMDEMGTIPKNGTYNAYNTKYTFITNDDITAKLQTALVKNGVLIVPEIKNVVQTEVVSKGGTSGTHTALDLVFTLTDGEETMQVNWRSEALDYQDKGIGKALTYGRKYFLISLLQIATGDKQDDPDESVGKQEELAGKKKAGIQFTREDAEKKIAADKQQQTAVVAAPVESQPNLTNVDITKKVTKEQLEQYGVLAKEAEKKGIRAAVIDEKMPVAVFDKVYKKLVDSINNAKE